MDNIFLMERDSKCRYKDYQRKVDMYRLSEQLKSQRRAQASTQGLSLRAILRRFMAGVRPLKPQTKN